jgi:hypothetical protein
LKDLNFFFYGYIFSRKNGNIKQAKQQKLTRQRLKNKTKTAKIKHLTAKGKGWRG